MTRTATTATRQDPAAGETPGAGPLLAVNNIEVVYNNTIQVLRGLSLSVDAGGVVALLGSNGAGKSTTLKAISGLLRLEDGAVTGGDIRLDDSSTLAVRPHNLVHRGLVHVMEGRHVFEDLTVEENLTAATYARPAADRNAFDLVYTYFPRLHERRKGLAGYLSGGEQQMLAIGRALLAAPRVILLDEPSLGLSPMLTEEIFEIIARINAEQGAAILLVEQNAAMAFAIADYAYIMETGRVMVDGPAEHLAEDRDVQEFYLGMGEQGAAKSYRDVKHYKRRKRWLS